MIGNDAFCPKTGAELSDQKEYDEQGNPYYVSLLSESTVESHLPGELTNGATSSSRVALFNYFRRCHTKNCEKDNSLYRKAALSLRRLKKTAEGREDWDVHIWYALQYRLNNDGFDVEWMHAHAALRCPYCHGRLKFGVENNGDLYALCGTNCTNNKENQLENIRELIVNLYFRSFSESIDSDNILQPCE